MSFCCYCSTFFYLIGGLLILLKVINKLTTGIYKGNERLNGKTVVVTGANSGIGFVCAKDFAKRGATVILACRNMNTAESARKEIIEETGNSKVKVKYLDLTSFASVRKCANEIISEETKIDILLNNAGAGSSVKSKLTEDGLNPLMQANYFGPFLFTNILLGKIKQAPAGRIVNVSSLMHFIANIDLNLLKNGGTPNRKSQTMIYSNSKLGNVYFSNYLADLLKGSGVTVNSLHPGVFGSEITREAPYVFQFVWKLVANTFFKSIIEGAQTSIYLCVSPDVAKVSGKYFSDCSLARTSKISKDMGIAKKLWEMTEKIVNLKNSEKHY